MDSDSCSDSEADCTEELTDNENNSQESNALKNIDNNYLTAEQLEKLTNFDIQSSDEDENSFHSNVDDTFTNAVEFKTDISKSKKKLIKILKETDNIIVEYQLLRPAYQDVTPTFADEVPFLVDGDSLMFTVMMDNNWSHQLGGSTLHLIYLFERYLNIFVQRGGTFHLVFFQNWRNIWHTNWNILLYRSILINHFLKNVQKYPVHLFDHCFDDNFKRLVSFLRPGFILTNMEMYEDCSSRILKINKYLLKHVMNINIMHWLQMDLPCMDTNYIKVDISIVYGFYLGCNSSVKGIMKNHYTQFYNFINNLPNNKESMKLPNCIQISEDNDIRRATYLIAAYFYYKRNNDENIVKIFFLTYAFMEFLELKSRCCPKFIKPLKILENVITEWHKCMYFALTALENKLHNNEIVCDMWHGILFGHICRMSLTPINNNEELGPGISSIYDKMVQDFNNFGFSISTYPIQYKNVNIYFTIYNSINDFTTDLQPLIPIQNQLNLSFCGEILYNIRWIDPPTGFIQKQYSEEHHYHSMKVMSDEFNHIKDNMENKSTNDWMQQRYLKGLNLHAKYMSVYGSSIEGRPLETSGIIRNSNNSNNTQKNSKKAQMIKEKNIQKKLEEHEKKNKETYELFKKEFHKYNADLEKILSHINITLLNKEFCVGTYFIETLFLKLNILRSIFKNHRQFKDNMGVKDIKKTIFLTAREIFNTDCTLDTKKKVLLSKCLSDIDCSEIAKRNNLPLQNEPSPDNDKWLRFQLEELGPELVRETGGKPDPRVKGFDPDPWQRELFDIVDKKQSALIVAPTSSGKTYASYYCMESVLKEGTEGVVVYVAPTKALVNQVAATVYARFKDTKMPDGMSVYGVFTRDYRVHALTSQVLITVPQCLEILLLSPRQHSWIKRLRYVIFDEIHCIEGNLGGASFERCLLLIRCPFLALSATIRNPTGLHNWLQNAEKYKHNRDSLDNCLRKEHSYKINLVIYNNRHSDLIKYNYGTGNLNHLHPYAELEKSVMRQHQGIPSHLTLSPAETIQLYDVMYSVNPRCEDLGNLSPLKYFSSYSENGFISRNLVQKYASELSSLLKDWFENKYNYFENTIKRLNPVEMEKIYGTGKPYIMQNISKLIMHLKEKNMLPAIVFAYDRVLIKDMTKELTTYLETHTNKNISKTTHINKSKAKIGVLKSFEDNLETKKYAKKALCSFSGNVKENLKCIESKENFIDKKNIRKNLSRFEKPLNLISEYANQTLQGIGVMTTDDISFIEQRLRRSNINSKDIIARAIRNGVCLHHGGLNNKIRSSVEMLFRKRLLNVVFATGTLALGIHMPCKTVIIAGNSPFLNSLEYQQMSGRAGRRGYDTVGNVIFLGINPRKQHALITSKLPYLKGNFPITVTLILRTLLLVSDVTDKGKITDEATKISISRVLTMFENSLCFMENADLKINVKHFFSFTLQLLKIQDFINDNGEPLKWCGIATHLHYHEPGNLAFIYLLKTGIIRKICTQSNDIQEIHINLLIILSYLFTRVPLNASSKKEFHNSIVVLEPLPQIVQMGLQQYNKEVRFVFQQYFANVATHFNEPDNKLPLSSIHISCKYSNEITDTENIQNKFLYLCRPKLICSCFATLSGNNDNNAYSEDSLITNLKEKMDTDVKVIPLIKLNMQLNRYAVDFFTHGIIASIIKDNGIKEGQEFTLISDFFLVIKTICVSLEEMGVKNENDIVYNCFSSLREKYAEKYNKAFGRDHL